MRTVIIANGDPPGPSDLARWLTPGALLICADGGARAALAHGLRPSHVIGDFDSLDDAELAQLAAGGAQLHRHPPAKNETDLELALLLTSPGEIVILGALGGRIDQTLANLLLLTLPALRGRVVIIAHGPEQIQLLDARTGRASLTLNGHSGDTVSLLPFGGDAIGVSTAGLEYPLRDETLFIGPARGVSNVMQADHARITLRAGMLACILRAAAAPR